MLPMSQLLLIEYREHYIQERERVKRVQATMDEVSARVYDIVIEMIDFEILAVNEELDLYEANQRAR